MGMDLVVVLGHGVPRERLFGFPALLDRAFAHPGRPSHPDESEGSWAWERAATAEDFERRLASEGRVGIEHPGLLLGDVALRTLAMHEDRWRIFAQDEERREALRRYYRWLARELGSGLVLFVPDTRDPGILELHGAGADMEEIARVHYVGHHVEDVKGEPPSVHHEFIDHEAYEREAAGAGAPPASTPDEDET